VDSTETTSSHRTVFEVILESNQELVSEQMAVMRYSNGDLVENEEYVRVRDMDDRLSSFPTAFFIIIGKSSFSAAFYLYFVAHSFLSYSAGQLSGAFILNLSGLSVSLIYPARYLRAFDSPIYPGLVRTMQAYGSSGI